MTQRCDICDSEKLHVDFKNQQLPQFSLNNIIFNNVEAVVCNNCGNESVVVPNHGALIKRVATAIAISCRTLSVDEFSYLKSFLEASGRDLSEILGVTNVTISRWENGKTSIPAPAERLVRCLVLQKAHYSGAIETLLKQIDAPSEQNQIISIPMNNLGRYNYDPSHSSHKHSDNSWRKHGESTNIKQVRHAAVG